MMLPYISYNRANKDFAKENRCPMTRAEKKIWFGILRERPKGYKFIRQKMIGSFILDFYCSKLLMGIEIDGTSHDTKHVYDKIRTEILGDYGIKIIRYDNEDVFYQLDRVEKDVINQIETRVQEIANPLGAFVVKPLPSLLGPFPFSGDPHYEKPPG